jgi:uncharacterized membrane protein
MTADLARHPELERLIAKLLDRGTWIASGIIALGLALELVGWPGMRIVIGGIAIFILLPVLRVFIMLIMFVRERDYRFSVIAALVLMIIALGAALGVHMAGGMPG